MSYINRELKEGEIKDALKLCGVKNISDAYETYIRVCDIFGRNPKSEDTFCNFVSFAYGKSITFSLDEQKESPKQVNSREDNGR